MRFVRNVSDLVAFVPFDCDLPRSNDCPVAVLHSNEAIMFFKTVPCLKCVQNSRSFTVNDHDHTQGAGDFVGA